MNVKTGTKPIQYVAVKAIIKQGGKILVLQQSGEAAVDGANRYHPPGGIVEPGEHLREALLREVREEIGLDASVGSILSVEEWRVNIRGDDCQFFGVFFDCTLLTPDRISLQATEAASFAWIGSGDLPKFDILEPSLSVIKKALAQNHVSM